MEIYIKDKEGAILNTANKYCKEDICVKAQTANLNIIPTTEDQSFEGLYALVKVKGVAGGTTEGTKLFATEEEMNADTTAQEGDLAVVYGNTTANFTSTTEAQFITFPETVVLPTAFTGWASVSLTGVTSGAYYSGSFYQNAFKLNCPNFTVEYTSTDGKTYTRTDGNGETVDFGELVKPAEWGWDDNIGYFMQVGNKHFGGLFEFTKCYDETKFKTFNNIKLVNNNLTYNVSDKILTLETAKQLGSLIKDKFLHDNATNYILVSLNNDNTYSCYVMHEAGYGWSYEIFLDCREEVTYMIRNTSLTHTNDNGVRYDKYTVDITNDSVISESLNVNIQQIDDRYYHIVEEDLQNKTLVNITYNPTTDICTLQNINCYIDTTTTTTISGEYSSYYQYKEVQPTELTGIDGTLQIKVEGKNLFNVENVSFGVNNGINASEYFNFSVDKTTSSITVTEMKDFTGHGFPVKYVFTDFKPNTDYTLKGIRDGNFGDIHIYTDDLWGNNIKAGFIDTGVTFNTGTNTKIVIGIYWTDIDVGTTKTISNIQLEEGTVATEFEPFAGIQLVDNLTANITVSPTNKIQLKYRG